MQQNRNILCRLDIFGRSFILNNDSYYKTIYGGLFTILFTIGSFITLLYLGMDLVDKRYPKIIDSYSSDSDLDNKSFDIPMAFKLHFVNGSLIENLDKFLYFQAHYINLIENEQFDNFTKIVSNIPLKRCSNISILYDIDMFCLSNEVLDSDLKYYPNYFVRVTLDQCSNKSLDIICASNDEIINLLNTNDIIVSIYYQDITIQLSNNTEPIKLTTKKWGFNLKSYLYSIHNYYIQKLNILSDDGLIFNSFDHKRVQQLIPGKDDTRKGKSLININIHQSEDQREIIRIYVKFQEILAQFLALFKVFLTVFQAIFNLSYSQRQEEITYKSLFEFRDSSITTEHCIRNIDTIAVINDIQRKDDKISRNTLQIALNSTNQIVMASKRDKSISNQSNEQPTLLKINCRQKDFNPINDIASIELIERAEKIILGKENAISLEFSLKDYILLLFCKCLASNKIKAKDEYYKSLKKCVNSYFDGINIIKTINDVENIKSVIFDEKQHSLFNIFSKVKTPLDNKITGTDKEKSFLIAKTYIGELKLKKNMNIIEKRILKLCIV